MSKDKPELSVESSPDPFGNYDDLPTFHSAGPSGDKLDMRILLVEDFATIRRIIRNLLADLGYTNVSEAEDGMAALPMLHNQRFDLLITDIVMPEMSGMELLKAVRADHQLENLPVLMLTSDANRDKIIEAAKAGVSAYIVKPFTAAMLESKIKQIFQRLNS